MGVAVGGYCLVGVLGVGEETGGDWVLVRCYIQTALHDKLFTPMINLIQRMSPSQNLLLLLLQLKLLLLLLLLG